MVPVEQSQEAGLSPSSPLNTPKPYVVPRSLQISQVPKQFLDPQRSSLADSCQLRRLEVGKSQSWEVAVL